VTGDRAHATATALVVLALFVPQPYYILKREGRAGFGRIGLFSLTWFAAWATGRAVAVWMRVIAGGD
jgi:hypothetical protein